MKNELTFTSLIRAIHHIHDELAAQASRAVNASLTLRNWLIGFYIREYEQNGADRAKYGEALLQRLSASLTDISLKRMDVRELRRYRQFYLVYPQIRETLPPELTSRLQWKTKAGDTDSRIVQSETSQLGVASSDLVQNLSFSHISELINIENDAKRVFYEVECIRGNWSVRELKPKEVMGESHLEDQLLDKLQEFLLEMGHGFCFEARQKRILIGGEYFFADLVFYHRLLKCHVLLELKLEAFNQGNIGQLNTYVSWYRKNMMSQGDNPPIGILLCTGKNHVLAEYALAGMDNNLFVSKYLLELPKKEDMQRFVEEQMKEMQ